jgi:hypothetical protein
VKDARRREWIGDTVDEDQVEKKEDEEDERGGRGSLDGAADSSDGLRIQTVTSI